MEQHTKHTGKAKCPRCELMHVLGSTLTDLVNRQGLDEGLDNADCINVLTRVLANGIINSAIPGQEAQAVAVVAAQLITDTGTIMMALGRIKPDADAELNTLSPEQLERMMLLPAKGKPS